MFYDVNGYLRALKIQCNEEVHGLLEFWLANAFDKEHGGIMPSVDRDGSLFKDEKPVWFQGRSLYGFGRAYNNIDQKAEWLQACHSLYKFMMAHCFIPGDPHGKMYFMLERDGTPVSTKEDIYSETFAAMGLAEYYRATQNPQVLDDLRRVFDTLIFYYENPAYIATGRLCDPGERLCAPMPWYMMLLCTAQTARQADTQREAFYTDFAKKIVDDLYFFFYDESKGIFVQGDYDEPGHTFEILWFVLSEALVQKDKKLIAETARMTKWLFDFAYDKRDGGMPSHKSYVGLPDRSAHWNARIWWVHNEMLIALFFAYAATGDVELLERFRMANEWVCAHFMDREYGEWYPILSPQGLPTTLNKGTEFKGPFHTVRQFVAIHDMLEALNVQ